MFASSRGGGRSTDTTTMSSADRIDVLCDAYEDACKRGNQPDFANYLGECDAADRGSLFAELMLLDVEFRRERGETPTDDDYLESYPEYAAVIETVAFKHGLHSTSQRKVRRRNRRGKPAVGHFQLQDRIGTGTTGEVWKALDPRLRRTVAIKIPRHRELSEEEMHRFLREGQTAAQLKHPAIVPVHEVGHNEDTAFIVSDFIEGDNLRERIEERSFTPRDAAKLAVRLADGLHHAHEKGVVHRDFKPANILLDDNAAPHITDFGLAKWSEDAHQMTLEGHVLGTPAYMAPEQARGDVSAVDRRADVYALGCVLYEMLTGEHPFSGEPAAVMKSVIHEAPRPPRSIRRDIPRDLETICLKAMEKSPSQRYQTAAEMSVDLERFLRGEAIYARRASLWEKSWRAIRRRPAVATAAVLLIATCAALSAAWMQAEENRALLGIRSVAITTEPPGAEVVFVPQSKITGTPICDERVRPRGLTPIHVDLKPGNYLVVARLPDGRFHEVYRHVPEPRETLPDSNDHLFWRIEENGTVELPSIEIPPATVDFGMATMEGDDDMTPFYMDTHEFTVAEYREFVGKGQLPKHIRESDTADTEAIWLRYDRAIAVAEKVGKRLPTEAEYEYAATHGGTSEFPWGAWNKKVEAKGSAIKKWGDVGSPSFDRLDVSPPVYGLSSNVAEWTTSWVVKGPKHEGSLIDEYTSPRHYRIARGGDLTVVHGDPTVTRKNRDSKIRSVLPRVETYRGLGFRCVRSKKPRYFD